MSEPEGGGTTSKTIPAADLLEEKIFETALFSTLKDSERGGGVGIINHK